MRFPVRGSSSRAGSCWPSMLLCPAARLTAVDAGSFDVGFTDRGHAVSARVHLDARGAPFDFVTEDRWYAAPGAKGPPVRTRWSTPVVGYREVDGRMLPSEGCARWLRASGEERYAEIAFGPGDLAFGVPPAEAGRTR
jgi:hypothetical protein